LRSDVQKVRPVGAIATAWRFGTLPDRRRFAPEGHARPGRAFNRFGKRELSTMKRALCAVCAVGMVIASGAMAQQAPPSGASDPARPTGTPALPQPGQVLNENEIKAKLQEEGYTEVTELQLQGPSYEAKAHKDGRRYNLTVDARTGNIRSRY
jgi:Peptidase propeptide and YPEB domain